MLTTINQLTTSNIRSHLKQLAELEHDFKLEAIPTKEGGWNLRILPSYDGYTLHDEARMLFTGNGNNKKAKRAKTRETVFSIAQRYDINFRNVVFRTSRWY